MLFGNFSEYAILRALKKLVRQPLRIPEHGPLPSGVLEGRLVRDGQLFAAFRTARSQHFASVGGSHSLTESVLVDSLPARRLESSFHCHSYLVFVVLARFADCKGIAIFGIYKKNGEFCSTGSRPGIACTCVRLCISA